jgi:hypothetical protein
MIGHSNEYVLAQLKWAVARQAAFGRLDNESLVGATAWKAVALPLSYTRICEYFQWLILIANIC